MPKCPEPKDPVNTYSADNVSAGEKLANADKNSVSRNRNVIEFLSEGRDPKLLYFALAEQYSRDNTDFNSGMEGTVQSLFTDPPLTMYETPLHLALWAQLKTNLPEAKSVLNMYAGNGNLISLVNHGKTKAVVNEIMPRRVESLTELGFEPTQQNALDTDFSPEGTFEVVMVNPPTETVDSKNIGQMLKNTKIKKDYSTTRSDYIAVMRSLDLLDMEKGRAFVMLPNKDNRTLNKYIKDNFKVEEHLILDPNVYDKTGKGQSMEIFFIDQRGKGGAQKREVNSYEDDMNLPDGMAAPDVSQAKAQVSKARTKTANVKAKVEGALEREHSRRQEEEASGIIRSEKPLPQDIQINRPTMADHPIETDLDKEIEGKTIRQMLGSTSSMVDEANKKHNIPEGVNNQVPVDLPSGPSADPSTRWSRQLAGVQKEAQTDFMAQIKQEGFETVEDYVSHHTGSKEKDLPYLTQEQALDVGIAIRNHRLGKATVIGNQTGTGKGRVMAMIAKFHLKNGTKPVFMTQGPNLYLETVRDLEAVKAYEAVDGDLKGYATNHDFRTEVKKGALPEYEDQRTTIESGHEKLTRALIKNLSEKPDDMLGYHFFITTYDQMQTVDGKSMFRNTLIKELAKTGGLLMDESHLAGGSTSIVDADDPHQTVADFMREVIIAADDHRILTNDDTVNGVVFASATWMSNIVSANLYLRMGLDSVMPASLLRDQRHVKAVLSAGGYLNMEQLPINMARNGTYLRTEYSWEGVKVKYETVDADNLQVEEFAEVLASITRFSNKVRDNLITPLRDDMKAVREGKPRSPLEEPPKSTIISNIIGQDVDSITWRSFSTSLRQLHEVATTAMKAKSAVAFARTDIARGRRPVIGLEHTNDAAIQFLINSKKIEKGGAADFSFTDILRILIDQRLLSISYDNAVLVEGKDGKKEVEKNRASYKIGPDLLEKFGLLQDYLQLIDEIEGMTALKDLPISPIDYIRDNLDGTTVTDDNGKKIKIKTGEITGRVHRLTRKKRGKGLIYNPRDPSDYNTTAKRRAVDDFQNGDVNVMILNRSGSTGLSLQAHPDNKNSEQRVLISIEPFSSGTDNVQLAGRIHRMGQRVLPAMRQVFTNMPADQYMRMMLEKKFRSMSATSEGHSQSHLAQVQTNLTADDFLGPYGDMAAVTILRGIEEEKDEALEIMDLTGNLKRKGKDNTEVAHPGIMATLLLRLGMLTHTEQDRMLDHLIMATTNIIQNAKDSGHYLGEQFEVRGHAEVLEDSSVTLVHAAPQLEDQYDSFKEGVHAVDLKITPEQDVMTLPIAIEHLVATVAGKKGLKFDTVMAKVKDKDPVKSMEKLRKLYKDDPDLNLWGEYELSGTFGYMYPMTEMMEHKSENAREGENAGFAGYLRDYVDDPEKVKKLDLTHDVGVSVKEMWKHPFYKYFHKELNSSISRIKDVEVRHKETLKELKAVKGTPAPSNAVIAEALENKKARLQERVDAFEDIKSHRINQEAHRIFEIFMRYEQWQDRQQNLKFGEEFHIQFGAENVAPAIVVDVLHAPIPEGGNPMKASEWAVVFLVGGSRQKHTAPMSQILYQGSFFNLMPTVQGSTLGHWPTETRVQGDPVISTLLLGNLLKASHFIVSDPSLHHLLSGPVRQRMLPVKVRLKDTEQHIEGIATRSISAGSTGNAGLSAKVLEKKAPVKITDSTNLLGFLWVLGESYQDTVLFPSVKLMSANGELYGFVTRQPHVNLTIGPTKVSTYWQKIIADPKFKWTKYEDHLPKNDEGKVLTDEPANYNLEDPDDMKEAGVLLGLMVKHGDLQLIDGRSIYQEIMGEGSIQKAALNTRKDIEADVLTNEPKVTIRLEQLLQELAPFAQLDVTPGDSLYETHEQLGEMLLTQNDKKQKKALIRVALGQPYFEPEEVVGHEAIHALRAYDLFTDKEWEALKKEADTRGWMRKYNIKETYGHLSEEDQYEEAIASAFGEYLGRRYNKYKGRFSDTAKRVFERIRDFFRKLASIIFKFGGVQPTNIRVFDDVISGKVGRRHKMTDYDHTKIAMPERFGPNAPESELYRKAAMNPRKPQSKEDFDKQAKDAEKRQQEHTFIYDHVQAMWDEASQGVKAKKLSKGETWLNPITDLMRYLPELEQTKERYAQGKDFYADFVEWVRALQEVHSNAKKQSEINVKMLYKNLDRNEAEILDRAIVFSDLLWSIENDLILPQDVTAEQILHEHEQLDAMVNANPRIAEAKRWRDEKNAQFRKELVQQGYLDKEADLNINYFRHQVLEHAQNPAGGPRGTKLRKVGYMQRRGSEKFHNMNVAQVDYATDVDSFMKIQVAKFINKLKKSQYNIKDSNNQIVKELNAKLVVKAMSGEVGTALNNINIPSEHVSKLTAFLRGSKDFKEFQKRLTELRKALPANLGQKLNKAVQKETTVLRGHFFHNRLIKEGFVNLKVQLKVLNGDYPKDFPDYVVQTMDRFLENAERHNTDLDPQFFAALAYVANQEADMDLRQTAATLLSRFNRRRRFFIENIPEYVDLRNLEEVNRVAGNEETHATWQPAAKEGNKKALHMHMVQMIPESLKRRAMEAKEGDPDFEQMKDLLDLIIDAPHILAMGGPLEQLVLPKGIINTLNDFFDSHSVNAFVRAWVVGNTTLKKHFLFFPTNNLMYFINNRSGDFEFLFVAGMLRKTMKNFDFGLKIFDRSDNDFWSDWKIVREFFATGVMNDDVAKLALKMGVLQAGFFTHEVDVIRNYDPASEAGMWATLGAAPIRPQDRKKVLEILKSIASRDVTPRELVQLLNLWQGYKGAIRTAQWFSQMWESTIRLRAFRLIHADLMKMEGEGMSREKIVEKLKLTLPTDPEAARGITDSNVLAARYARDLLGDYGRASQFVSKTKQNFVFYFLSFVETIFRRYFRLINNSIRTAREDVFNSKSERRAEALKDLGWLWSKIFFFHVMLVHVLMGDDESEQIENEHLRLLVNLGDLNDDGHNELIRFEGAFSPFLHWTMAKPFAEWWKDYQKGYKGWADLPAMVGWHYYNVIFRHLNPFAKLTYEVVADHKTFPRFEKNRPIEDTTQHLLDTVDGGALYSWTQKNIMGEPSPVRPNAMAIYKLIAKEHSIGQRLYYDAMQDQGKWMALDKDLIVGKGGGYSKTPTSHYMRVYERALRMADEQSALLALKKLDEVEKDRRARGKIVRRPWQRTLNEFLRRRAPVTSVLQRQNHTKQMYINSLNEKDLTMHKKAAQWYEQTIWHPHNVIMERYLEQQQ